MKNKILFVIGCCLFYNLAAAANGTGLPPAAPLSLTILPSPGNNEIRFDWAAVNGTSLYHIKRSDHPGGPYTLLLSTADTSFTDTTIVVPTLYYYVVTALDSTGSEGAASSELSAFPSIIKDNADSSGVTITGTWSPATASPGYYGTNYLWGGNAPHGGKKVSFTPAISVAGLYQVYLHWPVNAGWTKNAPVDVITSGGSDTITFTVNESLNGATWVPAGTYFLGAGSGSTVRIRDDSLKNGTVAADAVQFVLVTDTAALVTDCSTQPVDYVRMSSTADITFTGGNTAGGTPLKTVDNDFLIGKGIAGDIVRVFVSPLTVQTSGLGNYDNYVRDAARVGNSVLVVLSGSTHVGSGPRGSDTATYRSLVRQILNHYTAPGLAPNIRYIEAMNEYDLDTAKVGDSAYYHIYYKLINQEVNRYNSLLVAGGVPLQVGGPCTSNWNPAKIRAFVNNFASDPDTAKRMDFFSYHEYNAWNTSGQTKADQLIQLAGRRDSLESWLAARHLSTTSRLLFVTEEGIFPGSKLRDSGSPYNLADGSWLLMQAASAATYNYYFATAGKGLMKTFAWDTRLDASPEKSLLAPSVPYGPNVVTPFGNALIAMTLQGSAIVSSPAPAIDPLTGFGVYELTTVDSNNVTTLVWNWQHLNNNTKVVRLRYGGLPAAFAGRKVQMIQRSIDSRHSNYFYDSAHAGLQVTDSVTDFLVDGYPLTLEPNALVLLTLRPGALLTADSLPAPPPNEGKGRLVLFPNPAREEVFVWLSGGGFGGGGDGNGVDGKGSGGAVPESSGTVMGDGGPAILQLISPTGELLMRKVMVNNPERINIGRYARGVYYIQVLSGQGRREIKKLIIR